MNWNMVEYIPIEMCQATFSKTVSTYYGTIYTEMQSKKSQKAVTELAKKLVSGEMSQKLFQ